MVAYALAGSDQSGMTALNTLRAGGAEGGGEIIPSRTTLNKEYARYKSNEGSGELLTAQLEFTCTRELARKRKCETRRWH